MFSWDILWIGIIITVSQTFKMFILSQRHICNYLYMRKLNYNSKLPKENQWKVVWNSLNGLNSVEHIDKNMLLPQNNLSSVNTDMDIKIKMLLQEKFQHIEFSTSKKNEIKTVVKLLWMHETQPLNVICDQNKIMLHICWPKQNKNDKPFKSWDFYHTT